ncbi:MAG: MotA/TolQ/ExbB proton channel family protein [Blastochloris sp.]|nr:MotA/TolQ/ExbB proton channel family protein [Blastochloris sp.]
MFPIFTINFKVAFAPPLFHNAVMMRIMTGLLLTLFFFLTVLQAEEPVPAPRPPVSAIDRLAALPRLLASGGTTVYVQLALSIFAGAVAMERFFRLNRKNIVPTGFTAEAERLWAEGKKAELLELCKETPSTQARIIAWVLKHHKNSYIDVSRVAGDMAAREIRHHLQKAYPLAVVGMLEPLLGLLGTVLGMMETFAEVSSSGALGDAATLAGGISKFLVCTGTGLFIAVPCLGAYYYLRHRTVFLAHELEEQVDHLLHKWFLIQEVSDANPS